MSILNLRIPIGIEDFAEMRTFDPDLKPYLYGDKTLMIKDVIEDNAKVMLFTRPRRFGKTLNMSMLHHFFGNPNRALFQGLKIAQHSKIMEKHQGNYASIFLTLKDLKYASPEVILNTFSTLIRDCFEPYQDLFPHPGDAIYFEKNGALPWDKLTSSLFYLSKTLHTKLHKPVIIIIDEYDTPLQHAYLEGFYDQTAPLFRGFFEKTFKTNPCLYKGILTGITRIAKENLFSGLNNFVVNDIDRNPYASYFGFTDAEIQGFDLGHYEDIKSWYNGYTFGDNTTVYNPWSIMSYLDNEQLLRAYWVNTSGNAMARKALSLDKLPAIHILMEGGSISLKVNSSLVFDAIDHDDNAFFNLLYTAGYLTAASPWLDEAKKTKLVRIPNREVYEFYEDILLGWFRDKTSSNFIKNMMDCLIMGDEESFQEQLQQLMLESFSFHDVTPKTQESFYHGFLLGIGLTLKGRYVVKSNRESGLGRYDMAFFPMDPKKDPGLILEVKISRTATAEEAVLQMEDKRYATELRQHGCHKVKLYGLAFDGKVVKVAAGR